MADVQYWRGVLAPLDTFSGDSRIFGVPEGGLRVRPFPLPLRYAREDWGGHQGAVDVGTIERVWVDGNNLMGEGRFDMGEPAAQEVVRKIREGFHRWVSVDLDDALAEYVCRLDDRVVPCPDMPEEGDDIDVDVWAVRPAEQLKDWRLMGATLVSLQAFPEAVIELVEEPMSVDQLALVAAVEGDAQLPLAPRDHAWDGPAAAQRVAAWAKDGGDEIDPAKYRRAFFYHDESEPATNVTSYKLGFADVIDGELRAVPRGIFAVAGVLEGARGGADISAEQQDRIRERVAAYYERMADEWDDDSVMAPWEQAALVASGALPPSCWFEDPNMETVMPVTVTDEGHVFGYVALFDVCHVGIAQQTGQCRTAPKSSTDFAAFNRIPIETDNGMVTAGRITTGFGKLENECSCCPAMDDHACIRKSLNQAMAHHDRMETLAYVRAGQNEYGIWVSGMVAPGVSDEGRQVLAGRKVSGDWRGPRGGEAELVEVLALSKRDPGFPVSRARDVGQRQVALVAAAPVFDREYPCFQQEEAESAGVVADSAKPVDLEAFAETVAARTIQKLERREVEKRVSTVVASLKAEKVRLLREEMADYGM